MVRHLNINAKAIAEFHDEYAHVVRGNDRLSVVANGTRLMTPTLFVGNAFKANELDGPSFMLGWDSIAVCAINENTVSILGVYQYRKNQFEKIRAFDGAAVRQVVTRAVDTCTYFCIHNEKYCIIGHIDCDHLEAAKNFLPTVLPAKQGYSGICTFMNDGDEFKFASYINTLGALVNVSRGSMCDTSMCYFGHMEIGFEVTAHSISAFGDITLRAGIYTIGRNQIHAMEELYELPYFEFEGTEGLIALKHAVDAMVPMAEDFLEAQRRNEQRARRG